MVKLPRGEVDVSAGTGFTDGKITALVRVTVRSAEDLASGAEARVVWLRPIEARAVGLDLIGAAHAAIADAGVRAMARKHGLDGDSLIGLQRAITEAELGEG
jgi:hypothetical protein